MRVKTLVSDEFQIVAIMDGEKCPVEDFLANGEDATSAMRTGLRRMLLTTATSGPNNIPSAWTHEANKTNGIHEYIKGSLRLFFFKGKGRQIVVCTVGTKKSGQKADKGSVERSIKYKKDYFTSINDGSLTVIEENEDGNC